jgi:hypothetical protein
MDHAALPLGSACLQRRSIRKSARSALTSINSNNLNLNLAESQEGANDNGIKNQNHKAQPRRYHK